MVFMVCIPLSENVKWNKLNRARRGMQSYQFDCCGSETTKRSYISEDGNIHNWNTEKGGSVTESLIGKRKITATGSELSPVSGVSSGHV
jgi:hypothetical protein